MGCEPNYLTGYVPLESSRVVFESAWGAALPKALFVDTLSRVQDAKLDKGIHEPQDLRPQKLWVTPLRSHSGRHCEKEHEKTRSHDAL